MGNIRNEIVTVTANNRVFEQLRPAISDFIQSLPDDMWASLIVGPIEGLSNGCSTMAFLPDGSKQGWDVERKGHELRSRFMQLFDGTTAEIIRVNYGGDEPDMITVEVPSLGNPHEVTLPIEY